MEPRRRGVDDPIRVAVPRHLLDPWAVLSIEPETGRLLLACACCGFGVTKEGLWPDRDVHEPRQVGEHCKRCGRRWRHRSNPKQIEALLEHNSKNGWNETTRPDPAREVKFLPNKLPKAEVLGPRPQGGFKSREPRVVDAMRAAQEELAEDMVRPFREALKLRPDQEVTEDGEPMYDTPQLLRLFHSQARFAERLMDRTIGTPVQRQANLNLNSTVVPGQDVSMRAVDETLLDLINGELDVSENG